jgi:hypothetical protein
MIEFGQGIFLGDRAHDIRNEIKQSKQAIKELRKTYQASRRKKGAKRRIP